MEDGIFAIGPRFGELRLADPRFISLSDGFSRRIQRHAAALALFFTIPNLPSVDAARVSTAMATGISWDRGHDLEHER
jgi:hypothetical protein